MSKSTKDKHPTFEIKLNQVIILIGLQFILRRIYVRGKCLE